MELINNLHLESIDLIPLFNSKSTPSLRANLHVGPVYLAIIYPYTLRFFEGRQPL